MIIGLGGYAGVGKDAVARILEKEHGFINLGSFSIYLNECLLKLDPIIGAGSYKAPMRYSSTFVRYGYERYDEFKQIPEVRRLLQCMGTEVGRKMLGEDIWVDAMRRRIMAALKEGENVVVTALRYPNEVELIKDMGGLTVWVHRPGHGPINAHSSDNSVRADDFHYQVMNDGTLEDLSRKTGEFARMVPWTS